MEIISLILIVKTYNMWNTMYVQVRTHYTNDSPCITWNLILLCDIQCFQNKLSILEYKIKYKLCLCILILYCYICMFFLSSKQHKSSVTVLKRLMRQWANIVVIHVSDNIVLLSCNACSSYNFLPIGIKRFKLLQN